VSAPAVHRFGSLAAHLDDVRTALTALQAEGATIDRWAASLTELFTRGGRLLAAGNGGSAAEAQHLTAELVGRFETERGPLSAVALTAETSSITAVANDFGAEEVFARQAQAHGRPGDVLVLLTTSGRSPNLLRAAERATRRGLRVWAMTGRAPSPLADLADETLAVDSRSPTVVQELQLVAVHALCAALECRLAGVPRPAVGALAEVAR